MHGYGKIVRGLEALAKFEKRNKSKTPIASERCCFVPCLTPSPNPSPQQKLPAAEGMLKTTAGSIS